MGMQFSHDYCPFDASIVDSDEKKYVIVHLNIGDGQF